MKKNILSFAALLTIFSCACAQPKKTSTAAKTTAPEPHTVMDSQKAVANAGPLSSITMQRTACFGKCPAYYIEIFPDGLVRYNGQMFTTYEGTYEKNIGAAKTKPIFDAFKKFRADTCQEDYNKYIQDLSNINYRFKYGNKEVKILHADFGPAFLREMAMKIDSIGQPDKKWKKVAGKKS